MQNRLLFRQLFEQESSTYTYILADPKTGEGVLIDPVMEMVERDLKHLEEMNVSLKYVIDTHVHADHITAAGEIRTKTGCKLVTGDKTGLECADVLLSDGEELTFGSRSLRAISTPGHTSGCTSFYTLGHVFTGDTLMVRSCGRTDFQGGSASELYDSIMEKLYKLPADTVVYPAHDYLGQTSSTIHEEMQFNKRIPLQQTKEKFIEVMHSLDLPYPKKMDEAVTKNKHCGRLQDLNITPQDLYDDLKKYTVVDVRSLAEYEAGHIQSAHLATLGPDLMEFLKSKSDPKEPLVFICRVGNRSGQSVELAREKGFTNVYNLKGGMIDWVERGLPTVVGKPSSTV